MGAPLRTWPRALLEVGVTTSLGGRRDTGIEPAVSTRVDKVRDVLAVSSAGMLVRRDIWRDLKGFDRGCRSSATTSTSAGGPAGPGTGRGRAGRGRVPRAGRGQRRAEMAARGGMCAGGQGARVLHRARERARPDAAAADAADAVRHRAAVAVVPARQDRRALRRVDRFLGTLLAGGWMRARRDRKTLRSVPHDRYKDLFSKSVHAIRRNLEETTSGISERLRGVDGRGRRAGPPHGAPGPDHGHGRRGPAAVAPAADPAAVPGRLGGAHGRCAARRPRCGRVRRPAVEYMLLPPHDSLGDLRRAATPEGVTPPAWLGCPVIATVTLGRPSLATDLLLLAVVPLSAWSAWSFLRRIVLEPVGPGLGRLGVRARGGRRRRCPAGQDRDLRRRAGAAVARHRAAHHPAPPQGGHLGSWRAAWFAGAVLALLVAFTPALAALLLLGIVVAGVVVARRNRRQGNQLFFAAALGPLLVLPWTIELVRTRPGSVRRPAVRRQPRPGPATACRTWSPRSRTRPARCGSWPFPRCWSRC